MIEVKLPKGCILVLTAEEFDRAVARGKAKRRREAFEKRMARRQPQTAGPPGADARTTEQDFTGRVTH